METKEEINEKNDQAPNNKAVGVPRFVLPYDAVHPKCDKCGYRLQQLGSGWGCQHCGHGQTGCYWRGEKRRAQAFAEKVLEDLEGRERLK